jgi:hypothetical protein
MPQATCLPITVTQDEARVYHTSSSQNATQTYSKQGCCMLHQRSGCCVVSTATATTADDHA